MTIRGASFLSIFFLLTACERIPEDWENTDDTDTDDTDTDDTDTDDTDTDDTQTSVDCSILPSSLPDFDTDAIPAALLSSTPYSNTGTGLDLVITATDGISEDTTIDIDVSNVTVVTVGYPAEKELWVASGDGMLATYLEADLTTTVVPGDIVSFKATEVGVYGGNPQITALTDLTVISHDNPIYAAESNGETLTYDDDGGTLHHVYGELTAVSECGATCFTLTHSNGTDEEEILFRIYNDSLSTPLIVGDCVEVYAPLTHFNEDQQLNIDNFGWQRWFGNNGNGS